MGEKFFKFTSVLSYQDIIHFSTKSFSSANFERFFIICNTTVKVGKDFSLCNFNRLCRIQIISRSRWRLFDDVTKKETANAN